MRSISKMRWQLVAVLTAVGSVGGCSCHKIQINSANGNPEFINPSQDPSLVIVDGTGAVVAQGKDLTVDFGATLINADQANKKTITITNSGVAAVSIKDLKKADGFDSDSFKVPAASQVNQTIQAGQTATIDLSFAPLEAGEYASDFSLVTDADEASGALTIHLMGTGVANGCVLTPADQLDFGNVRVNSSFTKTFTIENTTPIDWTLDFQGISGADAALFSADLSPGPVAIAAHDKKDIHITFTAGHKDVAAAELQFGSPADMCAPEPFDLRGNGVDSVITADPDPVVFGFIDPGVTWGSVQQKVTLTNIGNTPVTLDSAAMCDGPYGGAYVGACTATSEFSVNADGSAGTGSLGDITLPAGGSQQVTLYFKPARIHTAAANMEFHTNSGDQVDFGFTMTGVGGGPKIQVQPTHIDYGIVGLGTFQPRNIVITNVGTSPAGQAAAALHITSIDVPQGGDFAIDPSFTTTLPVSLAATQRLVVPIRFTPTSAGPQTATVDVKSDDPVNTDVAVTLQADGEQLPPCDYAISPSTLNFGNVGAGRNRILSFKVTNTGSTDCSISALDLGIDTSSPPFSLVNGPVPSTTLAAGASLDVPVKFAPVDSATNATGTVVFYASSTTAPQGTVTLTGGSANGCLVITPDNLNYGVVQQGCASAQQTFTVYNVCSTSQSLTGIGFLPDANGRCPDQGGNATCPFRITSAPSPLPTPIASGQSKTFKIKYQPAGVQTDDVSVQVTTAQLTTPYVITLHGRGDTTAIETDTFRQDAQPKVDVLLVVDDSGSMATNQGLLAANFQSFIQFAVNQQVDYHIGVTSTSTQADGNDCTNVNGYGSVAPCGRLAPNDGSRPRIITSTTPNLEQIFGQNVSVGSDGDAYEMGLQAAYEALSPPNISGWNAGFLRDDANLAVVVVTDTQDSSQQPFDFYKNFFLNIKGFNRTNAFSFSAVVPTMPNDPPYNPNSTCGYDSEAHDNTRYAQMAQQTNGIVQEICTDDWATSLRQLGNIAFGYKTSFPLTEQPDTGFPIQVQIDGVDYPGTSGSGAQQWHYSAGSNSIDFNPLAVPEPGSTLTITYHVLCNP